MPKSSVVCTVAHMSALGARSSRSKPESGRKQSPGGQVRATVSIVKRHLPTPLQMQCRLESQRHLSCWTGYNVAARSFDPLDWKSNCRTGKVVLESCVVLKGKLDDVVGKTKCLPPAGATWTGWVAVATTAHAATTHAEATTGRAAVATATAAHHATTVGRTLTAAVGTDILHGRRTTPTTAATATTTATTKSRALTSNGLEEAGNLLVGLLEKVDEFANDTTVATVEEGGGDTSVSGTSSTTDTVDVVVDVGGQVVVDDVLNIGDIQTSSSDSSGHKDWAASSTEHLQSTLTLALGTITVDGGRWEALVDEVIGERICHALGLDEDEGQTSTVGVKDVEQDAALVGVLNVLNLLSNVLGSRSNTADREEDILSEEVACKHLNVPREGGAEHECLAVGGDWHVLTLNNAANLRLETHVKHAISLVEDQVLDVGKGDAATLNQIDKTTWRSNEQVTAALNLAKLRANVGTTVDDARTDPRTVGELASLVVDLRDKLTSWSENERSWVGLALASEASLLWDVGAGSVLECLGEDGEEETTSLSGTSLSTSHQITAAHDDGDGVLLHRCGHLVSSHLDVGDEVVIKRWVGEGGDRLGNALTGSLDWDVIVLLEVDSGLLLAGVVGHAEQLTLAARVGWTRYVLAVSPLSISCASLLTTTVTWTASSTSSAAVCVAIEATRLCV